MIKHIVWVFITTIIWGSLVMELPSGVAPLSADGLTIALAGPIMLCFLPSLIIALILAGVYYLIKKTELSSFKYFLWGIWAVPALTMTLGSTTNNTDAGSLIEDAKSGLIIQHPGKIWLSDDETIGAFFPSKPEVINVSSSEVSLKRFFSLKQYSEGKAQFSITIIPLNDELKSTSKQKQFFETTLNTTIASLGANKEAAQQQWSQFSDGRPQLFYQHEFLEQGHSVSVRGFYVADGKRVINVSVLYLTTLTLDEAREISSFLGTFSLIQ